MKATHNKASEGKVEWKFPCLGKNDSGMIVLFAADQIGIVIKPKEWHVGYQCETWQMQYFTPLPSTESVTLQND